MMDATLSIFSVVLYIAMTYHPLDVSSRVLGLGLWGLAACGSQHGSGTGSSCAVVLCQHDCLNAVLL